MNLWYVMNSVCWRKVPCYKLVTQMINYQKVQSVYQSYPYAGNVLYNQVVDEWRLRANVLQVKELSHESDIRLKEEDKRLM